MTATDTRSVTRASVRIDARKPVYDRSAQDWYVEPAWAVEALFDAHRIVGPVIWDPACGRGTIVMTAMQWGYDAIGSDIADRADGRFHTADFLRNPLGWTADTIVCNPPYALAEPFIRQALAHTREQVAMLLRLSFLESAKRGPLFDTTPLAKVLVFRRRVSMPPGDLLAAGEVEPKGGAIAFGWFIWDHRHQGPPQLGWCGQERSA